MSIIKLIEARNRAIIRGGIGNPEV
jgi:hypothetical protein